MQTAHLSAYRQIETLAQSICISRIGGKSDRLDIGRRPVAVLFYRPVGLYMEDMRRRNPKHVPIHCRYVVRMIEHQEIGKLLLAQFTWHFVQGKKTIRHACEGEKMFGLVPHHHI